MTATRHQTLPIENLESARFECVFPTCGGICCQNGRPGIEPEEAERLEQNLYKFLPHLRPAARAELDKRSFLTHRKKGGRRMLAVVNEWCVFHNDGCVLHKVGAMEGDKFRYKPWQCVSFPITQNDDGSWYVRQWGLHGEVWDLFCLNPEESPKSAADTLGGEVRFLAERLPDRART